jgi:hypothetical protein
MDSSDTQSPYALTDEQMAIFVAVALEEFGAGLTRPQFDEVMRAIVEHIPGFTTRPRERSVRCRDILRWKHHS